MRRSREDEIAPEQMRRHVRPMVTPEKFEDKVAITGIGASPIGRRLMADPLSPTVQALLLVRVVVGTTMSTKRTSTAPSP